MLIKEGNTGKVKEHSLDVHYAKAYNLKDRDAIELKGRTFSLSLDELNCLVDLFVMFYQGRSLEIITNGGDLMKRQLGMKSFLIFLSKKICNCGSWLFLGFLKP